MREVATNLWIGNAFDARNPRMIHANGIEAVVDLAVEETPASATRDLICCRIPIADGTGNSKQRLLLAVETVHRLVTSSIPTLVCCSAGMSRSPVITAAALACLRGETFETTLNQVSAQGPVDASPALVADVATALAEGHMHTTQRT